MDPRSSDPEIHQMMHPGYLPTRGPDRGEVLYYVWMCVLLRNGVCTGIPVVVVVCMLRMYSMDPITVRWSEIVVISPDSSSGVVPQILNPPILGISPLEVSY